MFQENLLKYLLLEVIEKFITAKKNKVSTPKSRFLKFLSLAIKKHLLLVLVMRESQDQFTSIPFLN